MKSKLIMRRQKKATILVSMQTAEDALRIGNDLANAWMAENQNDPRLAKLENSMDLISSVLKKTPEEMKQDGVTTVEEYFDDAKKPDVARAVKKEIDMIAELRRQQRPAQAQAPAAATASKQANGAAFVSDRDEKGEPKVPEKAEVPRLAAKKEKEAAPAAEAAPVVPPADTPAAAAPAPAAPAAETKALSPNQKPGMKGDILLLPSDILTKVVKALTSIEDLVNDKNGAALLADIAAELNSRPIEPEEQEAPKPAAAASAAPAPAPVPVAASFGGLAVASFEEEKIAVAPPGREDQVKALKKEPGIDNPYAVAWQSYNEGRKGAALAAALIAVAREGQNAKNANASAGGGWSWNSEKGDVVEDGGRTPEVSEAHSKIDESPAKLDRPATELPGKFAGHEKFCPKCKDYKPVAGDQDKKCPSCGGNFTDAIKTAAEMATSKALKEAERLGEELKRMYLDAKPITGTNDTRPVREAVEAIFRAADMFGEAVKVLNKQDMQEKAEEEAAKVKAENKGGRSKSSAEDNPKCNKCGTEMKRSGGQFECPKCGHVRELGFRALGGLTIAAAE